MSADANGKRWDWAYRTLLVGLIGMAWSDQRASARKTEELVTAIAIVQSNRFTALDWNNEERKMTARFVENERRLDKLEGGWRATMEILKKIESRVVEK